MRRILSSTMIAAALVAASCGGKGTTPTGPSHSGAGAPTSPSSPGGPAVPSGATVMGRVQSASQGTTIAVAGSSSSTALDPSGGFSLGVSPGDVQLRVTIAGANATVSIPSVQPAQIVEVVVSLAGASARLESEVRHGGGEAELKGVVEALPPGPPPLTFTAAGKTIVTNASTVFVKGGAPRTFADLGLGSRVEVKGTFSGDTLTASRVEIQEHGGPGPTPAPIPSPGPGPGPTPGPTPPPNPGSRVELKGTVSALTGAAPNFQFSIGSQLVKGDRQTEIKGHSHTTATFADLKNGVEVEVEAVRNTDGSLQAGEIEIEEREDDEDEDDDDEDEDEDEEFKVEGTLGAVSGTCPAISSSVGSSKFTTSASTRFDNACSSFNSGNRVEVRGRRTADGSIAASRLRKR